MCGLKGYSIELYQNVGYFDRYKSAGIELAFIGLLNGCSFKQIEISIADRLDTPRFASALRANFRILRSLFVSCFKNVAYCRDQIWINSYEDF